MSIMRRYLFVFIVFLTIGVPVFGQLDKSEHWIFVWDVTLSMCGYSNHASPDSPLFRECGSRFSKCVGKSNARYDGQLDIYDKVVEIMTERISEIEDDELGKISVIPFNDEVLDVYTVPATAAGKTEICKYIKSFNNLSISNTNIYRPLKKAMHMAEETGNMRNVIMLLTDGEHNSKHDTKAQLYKALEEFCRMADPNDAYLFYVMLTQMAKDKDMMPYLECCSRQKVIPPGPTPRFPVDIRFVGSPLYNIQQDGESVNANVKVEVGGRLPADVKFKPICEYNEYICVDSTAQEIREGGLVLKVRLRDGVTIKDAEAGFPKIGSKKLVVRFVPEKDDPYLVLLNDECNLQVVNKPEKKLIIRID